MNSLTENMKIERRGKKKKDFTDLLTWYYSNFIDTYRMDNSTNIPLFYFIIFF